jgi:hypothetical protein
MHGATIKIRNNLSNEVSNNEMLVFHTINGTMDMPNHNALNKIN